MTKKQSPNEKRIETMLTHSGRDPARHDGFVNVPVVRGSTVEFPNLDALDRRTLKYGYGRVANPGSDALENIVTEMENGFGSKLTPSGLSAISSALLAVARTGGEILFADCVYEPTRMLADNILSRMGVKPVYFDPRIGSGMAELISSETCAIFLESPGSLTLEIQDLPAIAAARGSREIPILIDNTWASPLYHKPLELGADIVVHSGTKYFSGHSDTNLGTITSNEKWFKRMAETHRALGMAASPDDIFLVLRGLRTLHMRMAQHSRMALELVEWLSQQDEVADVLHPALPSHPDHALFKRDFSGSGSVFSIELKPASRHAVAKMTDEMRYFALGYSYGGYESLILSPQPKKVRSAVPYDRDGNLVRLHIGGENIEDLRNDLEEGLARYRRARN